MLFQINTNYTMSNTAHRFLRARRRARGSLTTIPSARALAALALAVTCVSAMSDQLRTMAGVSQKLRILPEMASPVQLLVCEDCGGTGKVSCGFLWRDSKVCPKCNPWRNAKFDSNQARYARGQYYETKKMTLGPSVPRDAIAAATFKVEHIPSPQKIKYGGYMNPQTQIGVQCEDGRNCTYYSGDKLCTSCGGEGTVFVGGYIGYKTCTLCHSSGKGKGATVNGMGKYDVGNHRYNWPGSNFTNGPVTGAAYDLPCYEIGSEVTVSLEGGELTFLLNGKKVHHRTLPENCGDITLFVVLKGSALSLLPESS